MSDTAGARHATFLAQLHVERGPLAGARIDVFAGPAPAEPFPHAPWCACPACDLDRQRRREHGQQLATV